MPNASGTPGGARQSKESSGDDLIQRARAEIAEIVREVATLSRKPSSRQSFFASLIDRTVCAIAAEGAVLWDCGVHPPHAISRTGRFTDSAIEGGAIAPHDCLVREIAQSQTPAVVPSTPTANDPSLPANPTPFPAALVPIVDLGEVESRDGTADGNSLPTGARFVLEVFLESEAGVATQRGYLRFIAQMADFASEFLRRDEIRQAKTRQRMRADLDRSLDQLHRLETAAAVAAALVDTTARIFDAARASVFVMSQTTTRLLAVSHVDSIDHRGRACRQLNATASAIEFKNSELVWSSPFAEATVTSSTNHSERHDDADAELFTLAAARSEDGRYRLMIQTSEPRTLSEMDHECLEIWGRQSLAILASRLRLESVPFANSYLALAPQFLSISPTRARRVFTLLVAAICFAVAATVPVPMIVTMPATLRVDGTRTYYAPSNAVIESVDVRHGQFVQQGDVLMQLRDWALEEQLTSLLARRGVVNQRLSRTLSSLVSQPSPSTYGASRQVSEQDHELVHQQRLLEEELAGLKEQWDLLEAAKSRLTIRADQSGRVDAWQPELTATGRPVNRGEALVRVEPKASRWLADATIDQTRVGLVLNHFREHPDAIVQVATLAAPDRWVDATYSRREAIIQSPSVQSSAMGVELILQGHADPDWTSSTPSTVKIHCGKLPLVKVLFFDFVRAVKSSWARWV